MLFKRQSRRLIETYSGNTLLIKVNVEETYLTHYFYDNSDNDVNDIGEVTGSNITEDTVINNNR